MAATKNGDAPAAVLDLPRSGFLSVEVPTEAKPEDAKRSKYWLGIIPGEHPFWSLTVLGVTFARYEGMYETDEHGAIKGHPQIGTVVRMTDDVAHRVLADIRRSYARGIGTQDPRVVKTTEKYFESAKSDIPLGAYLFISAIGDATGPARNDIPTPLWSPATE